MQRRLQDATIKMAQSLGLLSEQAQEINVNKRSLHIIKVVEGADNIVTGKNITAYENVTKSNNEAITDMDI